MSTASIALIFFTACKKEDLIKGNGSTSTNPNQLSAARVGQGGFTQEVSQITVENDVLVFPSQDVFQKVVEDIDSQVRARNQTDAEGAEFAVSQRFENLFFHASLRAKIQVERLTWMNNEDLIIANDPDDKWIEGIGVRTLLNKDGAIKIGNSIFVVAEMGLYFEITSGNFDTLALINSGVTTGFIFSGGPVRGPGGGIPIGSGGGGILGGGTGGGTPTGSDCVANMSKSKYETYSSDTRKLKGKIWIQNLPFYASIGSESENFKKTNSGNWLAQKADVIYARFEGTLWNLTCSTSQPIDINDPRNDKQNARADRTYGAQKTQGKRGVCISTHIASDNGGSKSFNITLD